MSTQSGKKLYVCVTPAADDMSQAQFEASVWVQVKQVGSVDTIGTDTNVVSYDTWDRDVTDKDKGMSNAGDPTVETKRNATDPGQIAIRTLAKTKYKYPIKIEMSDAPDSAHSNTIVYNRGLITGPTRPQGRNEDFELEVYKLGFVQLEICVDPIAL